MYFFSSQKGTIWIENVINFFKFPKGRKIEDEIKS